MIHYLKQVPFFKYIVQGILAEHIENEVKLNVHDKISLGLLSLIGLQIKTQ